MFKVAGAETMVENLCYALKALGHDVIAVSLYNERTVITDRLENAGIKIVYLNKKVGFDASIFGKIKKLIKKEKPNVVHTHIGASRYAQPIATLCKVPKKIHTVHSVAQQEQTKVGKRVNKFLYRHNNVIPVALSCEIKKTIQTVYGLSERDVPVVFNGINLKKCQPKTSYSRNETFKILHIGRFCDVKNHAVILKGFAQFAKKHPDARLQLLGDGELKSEMESLSKDLMVDDLVDFAGLKANVFPWLHDADMFLLPSKYEGIPMSIIEAMGTGLPIVATSVGGIPDMLENGKDAILVENDPSKVAEAIECFYLSEDLRKAYGEKARIKSEEFSSEAMAKGYLAIYQRADND